MLQRIDIDDAGVISTPVLRAPLRDAHKHDRGHVAVLSGPALSTGAARLSAQAALTGGAGLVTLYGERDALQEHAAHVTAIMLAEEADLLAGEGRRVDAIVIGPGHGGGERTRELVLAMLGRACPIVLDADALTAFEHMPDTLFDHCHDRTVLTPHAGEFTRLFGEGCNAAKAAERCGGTVLLKGSVTHIAATDGRAARNIHASAWLATAGSGDVLAGMIATFLGQCVDPFEAACAAAWLHGDVGRMGGAGLTAEGMIGLIPEALAARIADD